MGSRKILSTWTFQLHSALPTVALHGAEAWPVARIICRPGRARPIPQAGNGDTAMKHVILSLQDSAVQHLRLCNHVAIECGVLQELHSMLLYAK